MALDILARLLSSARPRRRVRIGRRLRMETLESRQMLDAAAVALLAGEGEDGPVPDFAIVDTNSTSTTYQQEVSPRQFQGQVSGWYFGSAL